MQPGPPPSPPGYPPPGYPPPGYPPPGYPPPGYPPPGGAPRRSSLLWLWITLGVVGAVVVIGVLAAIAIPAFVDYQRKAKAVEAELELRRIGHAAVMYFDEHGRFPAVAAGPTPATPCCAGPGHKCAPVIDDWAAEPWRSLGVTMLEPHRYQYTFTASADGSSFTATAIGDLDCDGTTSVFTLTGVAAGGAARLDELVRPARID